VGASTARGETGGPGPMNPMNLRAAYKLANSIHPQICFGGVAIAERHLDKGAEDERLLSKHDAGCRFFVSQTVYDVQATKSLISDYALRFAAANREAPPLIFSFAPCGSLKTMEFMQWLGIRFPRWLENELRHSRDILERSVDLCVELATELSAFARAKGVPAGMNVESVSIRREEIEASCVLFRKLADGAFARKTD
jgi:5,10-methylenetetrahydrofolate reductase